MSTIDESGAAMADSDINSTHPDGTTAPAGAARHDRGAGSPVATRPAATSTAALPSTSRRGALADRGRRQRLVRRRLESADLRRATGDRQRLRRRRLRPGQRPRRVVPGRSAGRSMSRSRTRRRTRTDPARRHTSAGSAARVRTCAAPLRFVRSGRTRRGSGNLVPTSGVRVSDEPAGDRPTSGGARATGPLRTMETR